MIVAVAGAAPAWIIAIPPTDRLCPLRRFADGSRPSTPEGSRPAFAGSDLAIGSTPVRPMTGRRPLPPPSFTRRPIGSPCGPLSLAGGDGLTTLRRGYLRGLGPASTPVARHLRRAS